MPESPAAGSTPRTVLLTGAAGGLGTRMRELLPHYGWNLRLLDMHPVADAPDAHVLDLGTADADALRTAVRGAEAIVHLAGISLESTFEKILAANIRGTYALYEAARAEGVRRVVFASSNHAIGFTPVPADGTALIPPDTPHRPDTFYGLSKSFGEDLAQLYRDRHGIETVSIRIGSCQAAPASVRELSTWLSFGDCARLLHAALTAPDVGHTVVHGSSANTRLWWDLAPARALGYAPRDDSERYAAELVALHGELDTDDPDQAHLGGEFCTRPPRWPH
ncbi:NAD(P)-dependent oxidoreductase [Streptomyces sp. WMMB303]|uniref:NAD-dependent epimerase/dehydratase family protein n=1 Tax=Streptomyces sp. WMMB303 TaxID=3034154 RepID=UPI0023EDB1A5|nr:NAD(P)-dependent oxidoreductase [Streptomyces sp. WMMB303]MDF4249834.1 NAD(P)-dependent oxidoreductase [Streptomyces sp. WMMB303]